MPALAPAERTFWWQWILATSVSWTVVGLLAEAVREPIAPEATLVTLWTGVGLCMGIGQAFALRRHLDGAGWWIWSSLVGWSFGLPLAAFVDHPAAWPTLGLFTGAVQYGVLRDQLRYAWVWVPVSTAAWAAAMGGGEQIAVALRDYLVWVAIWPPVWALTSALTGGAMMWLLRFPRPVDGSESQST